MYGGIDQGSIPCMGIKLNREKRHMFVLQDKDKILPLFSTYSVKKTVFRSSARPAGKE